jgi:hypothetical protein
MRQIRTPADDLEDFMRSYGALAACAVLAIVLIFMVLIGRVDP